MTPWARSIVFSFLSPLLAALALSLFLGFGYGKPIWLLDQSIMLIALFLGVAFISGSLLLRLRVFRAQQPLWLTIRIAAVGALVSLPWTVALLLTDVGMSRLVLVYELALLFGLLLINGSSLPDVAKLLVNFGLVAVAALPSVSGSYRSDMRLISGTEIEFDDSVDYAFSSLYDLRIVDYVVFDKKREADGGGLEQIDENRLLLITGDGESFLVSIHADDLQIETGNIHVPINRNAYLDEATDPSLYFRVTDILLEPGDAQERSLLVAHHHWDSAHQCLILQMSEARVDFSMANVSNPGGWRTRFASQPCISVDRLPNTNGGRLAFLTRSSILMTVGDHGAKITDLVPSDESSYGKIVEIDRRDWTSKVFSKGHRNPQGLLVSQGEIWETEHGPRGGDELNRIVEGEDYGWPFETYGTSYRKKTSPLGDTPGDHSTKRRPVYAWTPSIGVSNLIRITGTAFPRWKGDLLVSSLSGRGNGYSLFRVRIREDRAVLVERIETGLRIRDLLELPDGRLVLWDGDDTIQIVEPANHVFSRCSGCHALRWRSHGIGPDLWGVVGQRVARQNNYQYSRALRDFGGKWSPKRLDAFLADPDGTVPGTTMEFPGVEDAEERRAIIEYLQKLPD